MEQDNNIRVAHTRSDNYGATHRMSDSGSRNLVSRLECVALLARADKTLSLRPWPLLLTILGPLQVPSTVVSCSFTSCEA